MHCRHHCTKLQDIKLELQGVLGIPPVAQFLVYKGQYLSNSKCLGDYAIPAAPRPIKLAYRRRRNKRGVQQAALKPQPSRKSAAYEEDGAIAGCLSLGASDPLADAHTKAPAGRSVASAESGTESDGHTENGEDKPRDTSVDAASPGKEEGSGSDSDNSSISAGDIFKAEREATWNSDSDVSSDLFEDGASQKTASVPEHRIPLLARPAARSRSVVTDQWVPEQVCEEQGDSHRSTVVYFTASAMVAQQLARHFTWKVEGSFTSAVVAQAHRRETARHKQAVQQVRLQRKLDRLHAAQ